LDSASSPRSSRLPATSPRGSSMTTALATGAICSGAAGDSTAAGAGACTVAWLPPMSCPNQLFALAPAWCGHRHCDETPAHRRDETGARHGAESCRLDSSVPSGGGSWRAWDCHVAVHRTNGTCTSSTVLQLHGPTPQSSTLPHGSRSIISRTAVSMLPTTSLGRPEELCLNKHVWVARLVACPPQQAWPGM
jgi:hypothetical protein